jgi:hypothetical protein
MILNTISFRADQFRISAHGHPLFRQALVRRRSGKFGGEEAVQDEKF